MRINRIKKLTVFAGQESLKKIRNFVIKYGTKMSLNSRQINHLKLCIDEACSNVIRHAYEGMNIKNPHLLIEMINAKEYVEIKVIDWGKEFQIEFVKDTLNLDKYVHDRKKGGLGLVCWQKIKPIG